MSRNFSTTRYNLRQQQADSIVERAKIKQTNENLMKKNIKKNKKYKNKIIKEKDLYEENLFYIDKKDNLRKNIKLYYNKKKNKADELRNNNFTINSVNLYDIVMNVADQIKGNENSILENNYYLEKLNSNLLIKNEEYNILFKLIDTRLENK